MLLRYSTPIISLLIATFAVVGPMRTKSDGGQTVLTVWGWSTIALAILFCGLTILATYRQTAEARRERIRAEEAERIVHRTALSALTPGIGRLKDVVTLCFLLPHLASPEADPRNMTEEDKRAQDRKFYPLMNRWIKGSPEENPRNIPDRLKWPQRIKIDPLSDEWINSLKEFNFIPLRGWTFRSGLGYDNDSAVFSNRDDWINRDDPYGTTVPYCLERREFHEIVSGEARKAKAELQSAIDTGALTDFPSETLDSVTNLIAHPYLDSLMTLAEDLRRRVRLEDGYQDPQSMKVSIIEGPFARGPSLKNYRDFMKLLMKLDSGFRTTLVDRQPVAHDNS